MLLGNQKYSTYYTGLEVNIFNALFEILNVLTYVKIDVNFKFEVLKNILK